MKPIKRILIVADEIGEIFELYLKGHDYATVRLKTHSVEEIVDTLRESRFDSLILTNNCCIRIDEFGHAMDRAAEICPAIIKIVASGYCNQKCIHDWELAGADLIMKMPFRRHTLLGNLEILLAHPRQRSIIDLGN
jgi:hypothetical protein